MRQPDIGGQDTVGQPRERLLGGVRVDRAQAAQVPGVERLEQIEGFGATHFAHQDAIRTMSQCSAQEVCDRDRRYRRLLPQRYLRTPRFESDEVRLFDPNL